jgi:plasmid stabilization system protein ParE
MTLTIEISQDAKADLAEATAWYDNRQHGLGATFLDEVEVHLRGIARDPDRCLQIRDGVYFKRMKRFPYVAYFMVDATTIWVFAVLHNRRDSSNWQSRL